MKREIKVTVNTCSLPPASSEEEVDPYSDHTVEWHHDGTATVRDGQGNVVSEDTPYIYKLEVNIPDRLDPITESKQKEDDV